MTPGRRSPSLGPRRASRSPGRGPRTPSNERCIRRGLDVAMHLRGVRRLEHSLREDDHDQVDNSGRPARTIQTRRSSHRRRSRALPGRMPTIARQRSPAQGRHASSARLSAGRSSWHGRRLPGAQACHREAAFGRMNGGRPPSRRAPRRRHRRPEDGSRYRRARPTRSDRRESVGTRSRGGQSPS